MRARLLGEHGILMSETTPPDNFEHTLSCATVGYPEETGDVCTCGADRAKAAWNAAVGACQDELKKHGFGGLVRIKLMTVKRVHPPQPPRL